ncbi:LADA_0C08724g1_1 [Lachancea dasiensis]|uniref:LADA_0C08724g1_1 n=1 Tax=Lachancea dasiensis TaxID=1072105 RepID=A0A1G4J046_9SACH|nr:LADA_0C08724g1_1 [Lachancea dasiensis]
MNFLFKSISGFQFPYSLESEPLASTPIWQAVNGHRKSDSLPVTVFSFDKRAGDGGLGDLVANAVYNFKVLKLPGIVKVLDVLESNPSTSYVVTERVQPLETQNLSQQALNLGLYQLTETLECLHNQAKVVLATLSTGTVFVNERGEWRIFGLELCSKLSDLTHLKRWAGTYKNLVSGTKLDIPALTTSNADSMLLARFVSSVYSHRPAQWNPLLSSLEQGRLTLAQFIARAKETRPFQSTLVYVYLDLKEFHIKDPQGKIVAMMDLQRKIMEDPKALRGCTPGFVEHYLIPEVAQCIAAVLDVQAQQPMATNTTSVLSFVALLLELTCSEDPITDSKPVFDKYVKPLIFDNFKQPDRQVRFLLLVYFAKYISKLSNSEISDRIFPHFVQGLADNDETMRIQTLKRIPDIVPMINERQLNNDLLRHLAKTQVDANVEIRVWTILTISGLSKKLSASNNRSGILATAFTKSLKDPQIKPRLAALYGLETSLELFDVETIANKILTVIAPSLLDKNQQVRSKAKTLFRVYLSKLELEAEEIPTDNSEEIAVNFGASFIQDDANVVDKFMETLRFSSPPVMEQHNGDTISKAQSDAGWASEEATWQGTGVWEDSKTDDTFGKAETPANVRVSSKGKPPGASFSGNVRIQKSWNDELEEDDWDSWNNATDLQTQTKAPKKNQSLNSKHVPNNESLMAKEEDLYDHFEDDAAEDGWGDEW